MTSRDLKFGLLVFPGFEVLDVFGPIEAFNCLARSESSPVGNITLSILSADLNLVSSATGESVFAQSIKPTDTLANAPAIDVLLVPGGVGTREPSIDVTQPHVDYIKKVFPNLKHLLTVCTGASLAARAGVLDGKRATTNKSRFGWVASHGPKTYWVAKARWVKDGKIWTSSGVSAGIDAAMAWIEDTFGHETMVKVTHMMELTGQADQDGDPYADIYDLHDIPPRQS